MQISIAQSQPKVEYKLEVVQDYNLFKKCPLIMSFLHTVSPDTTTKLGKSSQMIDIMEDILHLLKMPCSFKISFKPMYMSTPF